MSESNDGYLYNGESSLELPAEVLEAAGTALLRAQGMIEMGVATLSFQPDALFQLPLSPPAKDSVRFTK